MHLAAGLRLPLAQTEKATSIGNSGRCRFVFSVAGVGGCQQHLVLQRPGVETGYGIRMLCRRAAQTKT